MEEGVRWPALLALPRSGPHPNPTASAWDPARSCVCVCVGGWWWGGGQVLGAALAVGRRIFRLRGTLLDEITDYIGANARDRSNMRNGHVR